MNNWKFKKKKSIKIENNEKCITKHIIYERTHPLINPLLSRRVSTMLLSAEMCLFFAWGISRAQVFRDWAGGCLWAASRYKPLSSLRKPVG